MNPRGRLSGLAAAAAMLAAAGPLIGPPLPPGTAPRPSRTAPKLASKAWREPNGLTFRSLRRAQNAGWTTSVVVKPERRKLYLSSHARQREALLEILKAR